ncbi:MAG: ABC transporter permease subunit [Sporichthyaceae bacterium]
MKPEHRTALFAAPLAAFVLLGILAPWIAPYDPIGNDLANSLADPSSAHLLGTDQLGRDALSRIIQGARTSLVIVAAVLVISTVIGTVVGTASGYLRGRVDALVGRVIDASIILPSILIALAVIGLRGPGTSTLILAMSLTGWAPYARLARSRVLAARGGPQVEALRVVGLGHTRILGRHLMPVALTPVMVYASTHSGALVLEIATLSFLGLGVPPPTPEWGQMLIDSRPFLGTSWWLAVAPGVAITLVALSANLLGEHLARAGAHPPVRRRRSRDDASTAEQADMTQRHVLAVGAVTETGVPAPVLSVHGLHVSFPGRNGPVEVLHGIDYKVSPGRTLAIVGPSGSGKTLSVLAPLGLASASAAVSGTVSFAPFASSVATVRDAGRVPVLDPREVGVVFQESAGALNPLRTVASLLGEALRNAGVPRTQRPAKALDLLAEVGLPRPDEVAAARPHQLSGGMRQRVMIAIATAGDPRLLIADEPTSALDTRVQAGILELLAHLREQHAMAMVLISHDLAVVAELADEIAVVSDGQICERGLLGQVVREPAHALTAELLALVPALPLMRSDWASGPVLQSQPGSAR